MKIAVVGCGAVGSYYGAKLLHAGHEVHFLLRSDYDAVRRRGVLVRSPQGNLTLRPRCALRPEDIGHSDLVLIGLKTTANQLFPILLPPLVSNSTAVLTLQNGLGNEEQLANLFPASQVLGGLCFVCLNRVAPGEIVHLDHGRIVLGEFSGWPEPRTHDIASAFRAAGVPCAVTDNLARVHWEKLVWNVPFNGLGVASAAGIEAVREGLRPAGKLGECLDTSRLLADSGWLDLVRQLMLEVIAVAGNLGHNIDPSLAEVQISRTRSMGAYKASTLIDFERGQPLELNSLFLEPLRQARNTATPAPLLQNLCTVLSALDPAAKPTRSGQGT